MVREMLSMPNSALAMLVTKDLKDSKNQTTGSILSIETYIEAIGGRFEKPLRSAGWGETGQLSRTV